jgi:hypothetical protein
MLRQLGSMLSMTAATMHQHDRHRDAPAVFLMSMVTGSTSFIIVRCCIGFSLACFVCCQFWCAPKQLLQTQCSQVLHYCIRTMHASEKLRQPVLCLQVVNGMGCRTSIMFSPNIVGTANAFAGGWGNMGASHFCHRASHSSVAALPGRQAARH